MLDIQGLDHVAITTSDPARSVAFYRDVVGLKPAHEWPGEVTMLKCGSSYFAIAWWNRGKSGANQPPITVDHFAFRLTAKAYQAAKAELARLGVPLEREADYGIARSLYIRDPDGHSVELTCYEVEGTTGTMPRHLD